MHEFLLFLEANQNWVYLLLGLVGLVYLRFVLRAFNEYRVAVFGLERQRSLTRTMRSAAILALVVAGLLATFILTTFAVPAIPAAFRPTPIPTVSLLATAPPQAEEVSNFATATPFSVELVDSAGCTNESATILEPLSGESVQGQVEFRGTANLISFAFYKLEYHDLQPDSPWLAISASNTPVCPAGCEEEALLGVWDTSLVRPGQYAIQLVVTDTSGNAPLPCQILIQVLP
jgi:hypothetical protein